MQISRTTVSDGTYMCNKTKIRQNHNVLAVLHKVIEIGLMVWRSCVGPGIAFVWRLVTER